MFDPEEEGKIPVRKMATAVRVAGHNPTGDTLKQMRREVDPEGREILIFLTLSLEALHLVSGAQEIC